MKHLSHKFCAYRLAATLLFSAFAISSYGQVTGDTQRRESASPIPMIVAGNHWSVLHSSYSGTSTQLYLDRETNSYVLGNAQEIDGKMYHQLSLEAKSKHIPIVWVREDLKNGKIYCRPKEDKGEEYLVFDYSVKPGDIVPMCTGNWIGDHQIFDNYRVDSITHRTIAGADRRIYWLSNKIVSTGQMWVEGIGTPNGHFFVHASNLVGGSMPCAPHPSLLCFSDAKGNEWVKSDLGCMVNDRKAVDAPPTSSLSMLGKANSWHILKTKRENIDGQLYKISETMTNTIGKTVTVSGKAYTEIIESDSLGRVRSTNLLREEGHKLYWLSPYNKRDVLIFDDNAMPGDVLSVAAVEGADDIIGVRVESIESMTIAGKSRRVYRLKPSNANKMAESDAPGLSQYQWIEGLGSPEYGWRMLLILLTGGFPDQLLCVSDANGDWTKDPKIGCNYYKKELLKGWPDGTNRIDTSSSGIRIRLKGTVLNIRYESQAPRPLFVYTLSGETLYALPSFDGEANVALPCLKGQDIVIIRCGKESVKVSLSNDQL